MISFHTSNERDAVLFCQVRRKPEDVKTVVSQSRPLEVLEEIDIDTCVKNADYVPLLKWIWSYDDVNIPVCWLRIKHDEGHALLYYERAVMEFQVSPTLETLHEVCIPLIKQASFLVAQDCVRLKGTKQFKKHLMNTIIGDIETTYMMCLENMSLSSLGTSINDVSDEIRELRQQRIVAAVREVAALSLVRKPVKISWLRWYGRENDSPDEERPMAFNSEALAYRCARCVLKKLNK